MSTEWQPISTAPENKMVETKIDDSRGVRNVQTMMRSGRLWFTDEDKGMYVYYTPTHWRLPPESNDDSQPVRQKVRE